MSTLKDLQESFEFWINYSKDGSVLSDVLKEALELMKNVVKELSKEEHILPFPVKSKRVSENKVLGIKTQEAFDKFAEFLVKYRPN